MDRIDRTRVPLPRAIEKSETPRDDEVR